MRYTGSPYLVDFEGGLSFCGRQVSVQDDNQRVTRRDKSRRVRANSVSKQPTLVVETQFYTAGALVSFYAYTIGKLPNHKGR